MQKLTVIAALVVGAFLATSCSDTNARVTATGPTTLTVEPAEVTVTQSMFSVQPVLNPLCPLFPPFTVVVNLSIRAGIVRLFVTEIDLRFIDTFGVRMPQVTLPAPVLTTQFGSALVQARQTRIFPVSLGLGCVTGRQGTMTAVVVTRDDNGVMSTRQVSAVVR
jgi:hypothetical protein